LLGRLHARPAHTHVDFDDGRDPLEIARDVHGIDRDLHAPRPRQRLQPRNFCLDEWIGDQHILPGQDLRLADFGDRDPDRARIELHLRDLGDLVCLGVRAQSDAPGAALPLHLRDVALEHVEIDVQGRGVELERVHYFDFLATHSISTPMPPGRAPAWIVVRAGNGGVK
jgi:hypothetical protein